MEEFLKRLEEVHPRNWESWPTLRRQWPWFAALGVIILLAIPWGIRAEERSLESASRQALIEAGFEVEEISFTGRQATIVSTLSTDQQVAAVNALAEMGGVAQVTWVEGTTTSATTTTLPGTTTTTTAAPDPGAVIVMAVRDGRLALRGIVPAAGTIRDVDDAASDLWGNDVVNRLEVDTTVVAHSWIGDAPNVVGVLTMLIDPQLTLDADGATVTGRAWDQETLDSAMARLSAVLGPDVDIDDKVIVSILNLPELQIIAPGDNTVTLEGTVANADVRKPIAQAVARSGDDLEITSELRLNENTADTYMLRRIPEVIAAMGAAEQWTLRSDGTAMGGSVVGGKAFTGNKTKPTAQIAELAGLLASFLEANPNLGIEIEVHADEREGDVDSTELAQERADALAAHLVRLGIDPDRISASAAAGEGELLRFQLTPAEQ